MIEMESASTRAIGDDLNYKVILFVQVFQTFIYLIVSIRRENTINTFQRRHPRNILGINWQRNIANSELYATTKCEPWSEKIGERSQTWLEHLMRLHPETPERKALKEHFRKLKRPQGRPTVFLVQCGSFNILGCLLLVLTDT